MKPADDQVFRAVADPTRRQILARLAEVPTGLSISDIAEGFPVSRQGVTKHLDILQEAGLISTHKVGRERHCTPSLGQLKCVYEWAEFYRQFWEDKLNRLGHYLDETNPNKE